MHFFSHSKLLATFSLLLILIVGFALPGSLRLTTHAASTSPKLVTKSGHSSTAQPSSCGAWSIIPSPSPGPFNNSLFGVAAIAKNNVWAVGYAEVLHTLIEHWNGTKWSVVSSPSPGTGSNNLSAISALSANNIWVVGNTAVNGGFPKTLVEHWNGKRWKVVPSPNLGTGDNSLFGVAAVSATNIWAVGFTNNSSGPSQTLIEHWNGVKWSVVSSPNLGTGSNVLLSVAAISSSDVWAVGSSGNLGISNRQSLIEHWDGISWSIISSPNLGQEDNALSGVAAISASNIWAVGSSSISYQTLIEHWDGTRWSVISSPNVANLSNGLSAITGVSATNIWAVGSSTDGRSSSSTLIEHWDGEVWSIVPSPNPTPFSMLQGTTRVPGTNRVWAVGLYQISSGATQTLTESFC